MKISIGFMIPGDATSGIRYVTLKRDRATGEWFGEAHGYRFKISPTHYRSDARWRCVIYRGAYGARIESATGHRIKWVVQECTRLADQIVKESAPCPT